MDPPRDIRWQQRFENFDRALSLLREALAHGPSALNQLEKEGVIAFGQVRDLLAGRRAE